MQGIIDLYATQPFWIWLALGVILLAVEAALSTEWLLWPAVSAGVVAVLSALGLRMGLPVEIAVFAVLTIATSVASRRLVKRVNPTEPDINARDSRLIGQKARVVEAFVNGHGRVFISGSEWPADIEGTAAPPIGEHVVVEAMTGSGLKVRAI